MRRSILAIFITMTQVFCTQKEYMPATNNGFLQNLSVEVDTIRISLDSLSKNSYDHMNHVTLNNISYAFGLNKERNSVDVFNLTTKMVYKHILIDSSHKSIGDIRGFYAHDFSNMLVISPGRMIKFDSSGFVNDSIDLYKLIKQDFKGLGEPAVTFQFPLNYDSYNRNQYTSLLYSYKEDKDYLNGDAVLQYNFSTRKIESLPIRHSKYYVDNEGDFGFFWLF